ncbi:hypothetical protein MHX62_11425 [Corynebacterium sp. ACRQM]|jgi:argininosuccinate lyase|uniref:lyase family protein n=1 Tax=unclassified Corynebacterium TaxID=2624378 RepID=UPI001EF65B7D|nr:lyase family protein [Corynebacterium sp. ACRPR]MCG7234908.1 hypothetical protein [Corynebacterium sp. ACRPR]MCG7242286.1 hypothetical protein [Corynebacterium sp. ACRPS]MCG7272656.1 hypothetical protein [Corynebacterium sp. ACRQM]
MAENNEVANYVAIDRASALVLIRQRLITSSDFNHIINAVALIERESESSRSNGFSDYLYYQKRAIEIAGPTYGNVHVGRSRQDILITCQRMNLRRAIVQLFGEVVGLRDDLLNFAATKCDLIVPSFTNGVQAQVTTPAHTFLGYERSFQRITQRLCEALERVNTCPLGSAALAGTSIPVDRRVLARLLGFSKETANTFDGAQVSSIDVDLELMGIFETVAMVIGMITQDIHSQYQNPHPWYILDAPDLTQPSTLMPQKRNPVALNHVRMKSSRTIGHCQVVRSLHHNVQTGLTDHKRGDSWIAAIQTLDLVEHFRKVVQNLNFVPGAAMDMVNSEYSAASEIANTLYIVSGIPFRKGHDFTSKLVDYCRRESVLFHELTLEEIDNIYRGAESNSARSTFPLTIEQFRETVDPRHLINNYAVIGGAAPQETNRQLRAARRELSNDHSTVSTFLHMEEKWPDQLLREVDTELSIAATQIPGDQV